MTSSRASTMHSWDELARTSWKRSPEQRWFHDFILYPAICGRLTDGLRVLDYGCGTGELLVRLTRMGCIPVGVDSSEAMVKRAATLSPEAPMFQVDTLPADQLFDVVVMNLVLSCVENPSIVLKWASSHAPRTIFTVPHPCFSLFTDLHKTTRRVWEEGTECIDERTLYLMESRQSVIWDEEGTTTLLHYRSITSWFQLLRDCRLSVDDIFEPTPIPEGECIPWLYEQWKRVPAFMVFDVRRNRGE
jgi:SAM-dependent methyltransferase